MTLSYAEAGEANGTTASATLTVPVSVNVAAKEILVVCIGADNAGSGGALSISGVTDSKGNSYPDRTATSKIKGTASAANDSSSGAVYISVLDTALVGGVDTVSVAFSPDTQARAVVLWKVTCASLSYEFPATITAYGFGVNASWSGFSVTANDLVIGVASIETNDPSIGRDTDTTNGTWTNPLHSALADRGSATSSISVSSQCKVPSATGIQQYTNVVSDASHDWVTIGVVIRESTAVAATAAVPLGGLTVAMTATASTEPTVEATPVAVQLGALAVAATATVQVPVEATPVALSLGTLAVEMTATVITSATVDATPVALPLGALTMTMTADVSVAATVIDAAPVALALGALVMRMAAGLGSSGADSRLVVVPLHESTLSILEID